MLAGRSSRLGNVAGSVALLLFSSLLSLCLAEFVFRGVKELQWFYTSKTWHHELFAMLPDSPLEYALHPGVTRENKIPDTGNMWRYRINSEGFRGKEFGPITDRKRVLFLGDSYTFGWAIEEDEIFPESVKRVLSDSTYNLAIDAYNLGVPGYNTVQENYLLHQVVDRFAPNLVVLGYVMNDGEPQLSVPPRPSVLYKYVTSWLLAYIKEQINYYVYNGEPILNTGFNVHFGNYLLAAKENGAKWAEGRRAFADMVALCKRREVPFVVVIFPSYPDGFDEKYPFRMIHEEVLRWAEVNGVQAVDMLPYMQGKNYKEYMVKGDGHPNGRAFVEAAQVLAPIIYEYLEGTSQSLLH